MKSSDIFKEGNSGNNFIPKNKIQSINPAKDFSLNGQKDFQEIYNSKYQRVNNDKKILISGKKMKPSIDWIGNLEIHIKNSIIKSSFIACCIKGGLNSDQQISDAYTCALNNNFINNEKYVNINYEDFTKKVSEKFKLFFIVIGIRPIKN